MKRAATLLVLALGACHVDYVRVSRELAREAPPDLREPIVEKQRTYYDRDTSRPRLETSYRLHPGGTKVRHGTERAWYADGTLRWEREYAEGEPTGRWASFHPDGSRESETWPDARDPTKRTASWWHPGGGLSSRGPTVRGARHGTWTTWYPDGARESEGAYRGNRKEGEWTYWRPDGSVAERGRYRAGVRVGEWTRGE